MFETPELLHFMYHTPEKRRHLLIQNYGVIQIKNQIYPYKLDNGGVKQWLLGFLLFWSSSWSSK